MGMGGGRSPADQSHAQAEIPRLSIKSARSSIARPPGLSAEMPSWRLDAITAPASSTVSL